MVEINGEATDQYFFDTLIRINLEILKTASTTHTKRIVLEGIDVWNWVLDTDKKGVFDNYCSAAGYDSDIIRNKLLRLDGVLSKKELKKKFKQLTRTRRIKKMKKKRRKK